jgi:hypothetical protein
MRTSIYDVLKIKGETWYAKGEFAPNKIGYSEATKFASYVRTILKKKVRIIKRSTGYQVYSPDKKAINFDYR